jgi:hypothetical protein
MRYALRSLFDGVLGEEEESESTCSRWERIASRASVAWRLSTAAKIRL